MYEPALYGVFRRDTLLSHRVAQALTQTVTKPAAECPYPGVKKRVQKPQIALDTGLHRYDEL